MASTSCVRLLSAITVGSLRMMPRERAYTSVFAVPRSIARSRDRSQPYLLGGPTPARRPFGCERAQAPLEFLDAVLHRRRPPVAHQNCGDADSTRENGKQQEGHVGFLDRGARGRQT